MSIATKWKSGYIFRWWDSQWTFVFYFVNSGQFKFLHYHDILLQYEINISLEKVVGRQMCAFFGKLHCLVVHLNTESQVSRKNNNNVNHHGNILAKLKWEASYRSQRKTSNILILPSTPEPGTTPHLPHSFKTTPNSQRTHSWLSSLRFPTVFFFLI